MRTSVVFLFFLLCGFIPSLTLSAETTKARPNVLILYADDMGYGDLAANNPKSKIPTPHLDKLAASGTRFTDGHSSSGICSPSRYALLTGRHHWRDFHGIVNAFGPSVFKKNQLTMPSMFKANGYRTAAIGKWHLGWDWPAVRNNKGNTPESFDWSKPVPGGPTSIGFDTYFGDDVINFPPYAWIENDKLPVAPTMMRDEKLWKPIKEGRWECRPGPMVEGWDPYQNLPTITKRGVEFLESRKDQQEPFFLYFAFPCPHAPIIPNDEFDGKSQAGPFGDFVAQTDDIVGKLLAALERSGQADNTIVVFSADNGPEHYAYERDAKFGHWSAAPFRGLKRDLYEGGHHVPFVVRWPGVTKPGTTSEALVSQVDLLATFAAQLEFALPDGAAADSHNMLPYLRGEAKQIRTACVQNTYANGYVLRDGDWLLVAAKDGYVHARNKEWEARRDYPADDSEPVELFNLREDIGQRKNLAAAEPERVKQMQEKLKEIRAGQGTRPGLKKD
jgi:arylsulfatase A